jgi:predicted PurR-regulated permease PerM
MKKRFTLAIALCAINFVGFAQDNTNTIDNQFNTLLNESTNWQNSKIVQLDKLQQLQKNVNDSLTKLHLTIVDNKDASQGHKDSVEALTAQLKVTQDSLKTSLTKTTNIEVLGLSSEKSTFLTVIWAIIGVLIILLGVIYYRFKKSFMDIKEVKSKLTETEEELDELRKSSLEREQKSRRQLQDEINKNKPVEEKKI